MKARSLVSLASGVLLVVVLPVVTMAKGETDVVQDVESVVAVVDTREHARLPGGLADAG